jgi:hypothetical protein
MKKFLPLVVLALLLAGATTQRASAWCKFNFSCGCNLGFEKGDSPGCCSWSFNKSSPGTPQCSGPQCYGMALPAVEPVYIAPSHQAPAGQPSFPPAPKPADQGSGNQPASYWTPSYNYTAPAATPGYMMYPQTGYGYYAAPSYWYGR